LEVESVHSDSTIVDDKPAEWVSAVKSIWQDSPSIQHVWMTRLSTPAPIDFWTMFMYIGFMQSALEYLDSTPNEAVVKVTPDRVFHYLANLLPLETFHALERNFIIHVRIYCACTKLIADVSSPSRVVSKVWPAIRTTGGGVWISNDYERQGVRLASFGSFRNQRLFLVFFGLIMIGCNHQFGSRCWKRSPYPWHHCMARSAKRAAKAVWPFDSFGDCFACGASCGLHR
jgi:hypothetical protein